MNCFRRCTGAHAHKREADVHACAQSGIRAATALRNKIQAIKERNFGVAKVPHAADADYPAGSMLQLACSCASSPRLKLHQATQMRALSNQCVGRSRQHVSFDMRYHALHVDADASHLYIQIDVLPDFALQAAGRLRSAPLRKCRSPHIPTDVIARRMTTAGKGTCKAALFYFRVLLITHGCRWLYIGELRHFLSFSVVLCIKAVSLVKEAAKR